MRTSSSKKSRRSRPSTEARARLLAERQQAERAGLKSRSAIKHSSFTSPPTRNPALTKFNGIVRSSKTPAIKGNRYHNPRKSFAHAHLPTLPTPMTPGSLHILRDPMPVSVVKANQASSLAAKAAEKRERATAKVIETKFSRRIVDTDDEMSSGTDWDSDEDIDLSRPFTTAERELSPEKKYYGASGKTYLAKSYSSISQKRMIRRNMHETEALHDRPATATRHFVDNCHRLHIPPEPLLLRSVHFVKEQTASKRATEIATERETIAATAGAATTPAQHTPLHDTIPEPTTTTTAATKTPTKTPTTPEQQLQQIPPSPQHAHNNHQFHHHALNCTVQKSPSLLSLKHYGIGNVRAGAMSESLRVLPGLEHLDLSDCRLGDAAAARAIDMLVASQQSVPKVSGERITNQNQDTKPPKQPNATKPLTNDGLLSLDLSQNKLASSTARSLARAVRILPSLMVIKLSDCKIDDRVASKILRRLKTNQSCTVLDLSRNSLGSGASKALANLLTYNRVLTDLNVSWNQLGRGRDGINLVKSFAGSELRRLDLEMNVFGGNKKATAVAMLGKVLPDTRIQELNLSCNHINALPCCILMNGVSLHPPLTRLEINRNPVGKQGAAAVLRALDLVSKSQQQGGSRLLDIDMYGCACDNIPEQSSSALSSFDFLEPAGSYVLDLDNPEDYALACEILRMINTRNGYSVRAASYAKAGSKTFSRLTLRRKNRKLDHCAGPASPFINKKTGKLFVVPSEGTLQYEITIREHVPKNWNVISSIGFGQVRDLIDEQQSYLNRLTLLDAACDTFYFTVEQIRSMAKLFAGHELKHVMPKLMMRVLSGKDSSTLLNENRHLLSGQLAYYEPHCSTGRYVLDMANPNDRHLVVILMRNSNDDREIAKRDRDNYFDLSQHGDQSNFRNVTYEGEPFLLTGILDDDHKLPKKGYLVFDYVARSVQEAGGEPPEKGPEEEDLHTEADFRKYLHQHTISCTQLLHVIQTLPKPKDWMTLDGKITALFQLLDEDDGGEVDKKEVMMAIIERPEVGDFMCQIPELEPLLEPRTFGPAFDAIDQDGGGSLDIDEFRQMCGVANDLAAVAQEMFDADSDGEWDEEEDKLLRERMKNVVKNKLNSVHKMLRQQMKEGNRQERFDAVYQMFHEMDEGHKDYLMPAEFAKLTASLGIILSAHELKDAVDEIDEDGNGQIEVDEYLEWWGDQELIDLYEARQDALESGKPYRMMSDLVSGESPGARLSTVREMFGNCDVGNKDYLDPKEFQKLSDQLGLRLLDEELHAIIEEIDEDGNGQIEVDEYLAWWGDEELIELFEAQMLALEEKKPYRLFAGKIMKKANTRRKRLNAVQELFDENDGGKKEYLTPKEFDALSKQLGVYLSPIELENAVEEIDEDGNGQIEVDEYLAWWGDEELIELYEADEAGLTLADVEAENAEAEDVESSDEEDDTEDAKEAEDEDEEDTGIPYEAVYMNHQVLQHSGFQRVDYIVAAHQRLTDLHNFAYFWEFLSKGEVLATLYRLGWLNVFDPVSPDRRHYMDLEEREMQIVAKILVRLAVVEPGENWLYENYMDKPGWELPVTWINEVPKTGRLTLTYSSTAAGCAPVWEERIKLRKCCLIPNDAPLPFESGGMASLKASSAPITYPMFIRIMTTEESTIDCIGQAKADAVRVEEEKKRREEESGSEDEDEDEDEDEETRDAVIGEGVEPGGAVEGGDSAGGGGNEEVPAVAEPIVAVKKFRAPKSKGERNAYAFLETCKKHFLGLYKENEDLEECLSQEWESFCEQSEGRLGEDKNLAKAFKMLRGVFDTLQW